MSAIDDERYAEALLLLLQRDFDGLASRSTPPSVVAMVAEEVRREAGSLRVPRETARQMRDLAERAIRAAREARAAGENADTGDEGGYRETNAA
jgi:hypothetical protein